MNLNPQQEKIVKGHIKDKKRPFSVFSPRMSPLDPFVWLSGLATIDMSSIPEFRYGSLLYTPSD